MQLSRGIANHINYKRNYRNYNQNLFVAKTTDNKVIVPVLKQSHSRETSFDLNLTNFPASFFCMQNRIIR
jgi:hypothetical protein